MLNTGKRRPPSPPRRPRIERLEPRIAMSGYYVSPTGSDSAAGTVDAPWKTLQRAVASAAGGDVINLRGGTYNGGVTVNKPDITIRSFPGERATIVASTSDPAAVNNLWFTAPGGKALNLDLRGGYYYGVKFEAGNGLVEGCKVTDTGYFGIKVVPGADYVTISGTEVGNTGLVHGGGGIDVVNGDFLTIRDCYIHDTRSDAIMVKGGASGVVIERNRIVNSTGTGIDGGQWTDYVWFDQAQNPGLFEIIEPVIRNNIVIGTDYAGIALYGALRPQVNNNTLIDTARVGQASIYVASFGRFSDNLDPTIVNNIVTRTVAGARPLVFITSGGYDGTLTMDHNRYDNAGNDGAFWSQLAGRELFGNFALWRATVGVDAGSSQGNPGIDAAGRILAGSFSIDAGRALAGVGDDIDREPRKGAYDIGADEYPIAVKTAPPAPGDLTAVASPGRIDLAWAPAPGADAYLIERAPAGSDAWAPLATAPAGASSWRDAGLTPAAAYRYRVRATNDAGASPYSAPAEAATPAEHNAPAGSVLFADSFDAGPDAPARPWATAGGNWSQAGGVLRQAGLGAADPKKASVAAVAFPADVEVRARVRVDTWTGGAYARAGVSLGDDAQGRGYNLVFHADTGTVRFLHDQVAWGNSYAFAWRVGAWYHFALRQEAGVLYGKVWADGQPEPDAWMFRQDGWAPRAGAPGLNGGTYDTSTASFDEFIVTT